MAAPTPQFLIDPENPTTILSGATAVGAGLAFANNHRRTGELYGRFDWQTTYTGSPTGVSVSLQGSLDGANWFTVDTTTAIAGELRSTLSLPSSATFLRAYVTTLTGGTSPTATVILQPGS